MQQMIMILEVVQSKWSFTWYETLSPITCVLKLMNGHVFHRLREKLKVPGSNLLSKILLNSFEIQSWQNLLKTN